MIRRKDHRASSPWCNGREIRASLSGRARVRIRPTRYMIIVSADSGATPFRISGPFRPGASMALPLKGSR